MKLHELTKITTRPNKRVGRGLGSGKGKTAGRGTKGQKARGKIPQSFIGGTLPLYKRLPLRRGQGNLRPLSKPIPLGLDKLGIFKDKSIISLEALIKEKIVSEKEAKRGIKILGQGEIKSALVIRIPISLSAQKKIEEAGGKVE